MISLCMDNMPLVVISIISGFSFIFMFYLIKKTKELTRALQKEKEHSGQIKAEMESIKKQCEQKTGFFIHHSEIIKDFSPETPEAGIAPKTLSPRNLPPGNFPQETYEKEKQTVFIVEDNSELVSSIFEYMSNYFNIFYALNALKAIEKLKTIPKPDIILYGITGDNPDGYEFYHNLMHIEEYKDIPVFFLAGQPIHEDKIKVLKRGIIDYINKPYNAEELMLKVRSFLHNREIFRQALIKKMEKKIAHFLRKPGDDEFLVFEKKCTLYHISPREKTVLKELLKGLQTKEIATKLFLSTHTVKKHIRSIFTKCTVQNRVELVNCFKE